MKEPTEQPTVKPALQIRRARSQDRSFVHELAEKVFSVYGSYGRYLTDWSDACETTTLIGEIGDEPVGLAMLAVYPSPRAPKAAVAELLAIAVEPRFQSRGIGTILLDKALEEAPRLPSRFPVLEVHLSVARQCSGPETFCSPWLPPHQW